MSENFEKYNLEEAQEEADKIQRKNKNNEIRGYNEAEMEVDIEVDINEKKLILTPEQQEIKKEIMLEICSSDISAISRAIEKIKKCPQFIDDKDISMAIEENICHLLKNNRIWQALKIKNNLSELKFKNNLQIEEAAIEGIVEGFNDYIDRFEGVALIAENFLSKEAVSNNEKIYKAASEYVKKIFSRKTSEQMFGGLGETPIERIQKISELLNAQLLTDPNIMGRILGLYGDCLKKIVSINTVKSFNYSKEEYKEKWEENLNQVKSLNNEFFTFESILKVAKKSRNSFLCAAGSH